MFTNRAQPTIDTITKNKAKAVFVLPRVLQATQHGVVPYRLIQPSLKPWPGSLSANGTRHLQVFGQTHSIHEYRFHACCWRDIAIAAPLFCFDLSRKLQRDTGKQDQHLPVPLFAPPNQTLPSKSAMSCSPLSIFSLSPRLARACSRS